MPSGRGHPRPDLHGYASEAPGICGHLGPDNPAAVRAGERWPTNAAVRPGATREVSRQLTIAKSCTALTNHAHWRTGHALTTPHTRRGPCPRRSPTSSLMRRITRHNLRTGRDRLNARKTGEKPARARCTGCLSRDNASTVDPDTCPWLFLAPLPTGTSPEQQEARQNKPLSRLLLQLELVVCTQSYLHRQTQN